MSMRSNRSAAPRAHTLIRIVETCQCAAVAAGNTRDATDVSIRNVATLAGSSSVRGSSSAPSSAPTETRCRIAALERRSSGTIAKAATSSRLTFKSKTIIPASPSARCESYFPVPSGRSRTIQTISDRETPPPPPSPTRRKTSQSTVVSPISSPSRAPQRAGKQSAALPRYGAHAPCAPESSESSAPSNNSAGPPGAPALQARSRVRANREYPEFPARVGSGSAPCVKINITRRQSQAAPPIFRSARLNYAFSEACLNCPVPRNIVRDMKFRLVVLALSLSFSAFSQEFRAAVSGEVTDTSGADVPAAKVDVAEIHTNTKPDVTTDASGKYNVLALLPGDYDITVVAPGFKASARKGLHIGAGEHPQIDFKLEVGDTTQSIEVTADVPIVNSENASVGQAVTTKEVEDIPLNGRSPIMLAQLAVGVIPSPYNSTLTLVHPFDTNNAFSIGGTVNQTSETLLDGSPNATWDGRTAYSPPQDAVQEVRVKAFDSDASFGHTGGGTINQVMKSGTNSIHGSASEFTQPSNLTANNFFNNKNGLGNPVTHFNQYGVTAGGPVWIPKVYNGKDKLFWFFAYEGLKDSQPNTNFLTVPTDAEKMGNFSQILATDGTVLYNPYTAVQNGSTITRTPYAGNIIPTSQLNPIALAYLKYIPEPNVTNTARADGFDNFGNT